MSAILFALISYFSWGTGDVFGTLASRKINSYSVFIWFEVFNVILMFPLCFFFLDQLKLITPQILLLTLLLSAFSNAALILFYEALSKSNATITGTLVSCFAAVATVVAIFFFKEKITILHALAVTVIFIGIIISTLNFNELKNGKLIKNKAVLLAFIAMLLWGIYFAFIRIPVDAIGWFWAGYIPALSFPMVFVPFWLMKVKIQKPTVNKAFIPLLLNSILLSTGGMAYNLGIERGLTSIVAPIAGSYPTLFAVLSYFVFRDPFEKREIIGVAVTLVGIVLLSFTSIH